MIDRVRVVMIDGVREEEIESGRERDGKGGGRGLDDMACNFAES
jgi:hypothetical protein